MRAKCDVYVVYMAEQCVSVMKLVAAEMMRAAMINSCVFIDSQRAAKCEDITNTHFSHL